MRIMLALFIGIPLLEMIILIEVGGLIGALPTVALVVLTATLGIWLLRLEGLATLARVQEKMGRGELPGKELLEGAMLLVGGALLLTPGFVTDAIGFTCLIPFFRHPIANWLIKRGIMRHSNFSRKTQYSNSSIIEGEYEEQSDSNDSSLESRHNNKETND